MMLTVLMMIGTVEADRRNGSSQSRYQGYTTGALNRSDDVQFGNNLQISRIGTDMWRYADFTGLIPTWKPDSFRFANHTEAID